MHHKKLNPSSHLEHNSSDEVKALNDSQLFTISNGKITHFNGQEINTVSKSKGPLSIPLGARISLTKLDYGDSLFLHLEYLEHGALVKKTTKLNFNANGANLVSTAYLRERARLINALQKPSVLDAGQVFAGNPKEFNANVVSNLEFLKSSYSNANSLPVLSPSAKLIVESSRKQGSKFINTARIVDGNEVFVVKFNTISSVKVDNTPLKVEALPALDGVDPLYKVGYYKTNRRVDKRVSLQNNSEFIKIKGLPESITNLEEFIANNNLAFVMKTNFVELKTDQQGKIVGFRPVPDGEFLPFNQQKIDSVNKFVPRELQAEFNTLRKQIQTEMQSRKARAAEIARKASQIVSENTFYNPAQDCERINVVLQQLGVTNQVSFNTSTKLYEFNSQKFLDLHLFESEGKFYLNKTIIGQSNQLKDTNIVSKTIDVNTEHSVGPSFVEYIKLSDYANRDEYTKALRLYQKETINIGDKEVVCNPLGKEYLSQLPSEILTGLKFVGPFVVVSENGVLKRQYFSSSKLHAVDLPKVEEIKSLRVPGLQGPRILPSVKELLKKAYLIDDESPLLISRTDFETVAGAKIGTDLFDFLNLENHNFFHSNYTLTEINTAITTIRKTFPSNYLESFSNYKGLPQKVLEQSFDNRIKAPQKSSDYTSIVSGEDRSVLKSGITKHATGYFGNTGFKNVGSADVQETVMPGGYSFALVKGYLHTKDALADTPEQLNVKTKLLSPYGLVHGEYFFPFYS
jgi:hypothetical protein